MWQHFSLPSEGAKALLVCGADPLNVGKIGQSPAQVAQSSNARDVIKVLQVCSKDIYLQHCVILFQDWGKERQEVGILKIVVDGAGFKELNREYHATSPQEIPTGLVGCSVELFLLLLLLLGGVVLIGHSGFEWVCRQKGWNASDTWKELNGDSIWFKASTEVILFFTL